MSGEVSAQTDVMVKKAGIACRSCGAQNVVFIFRGAPMRVCLLFFCLFFGLSAAVLAEEDNDQPTRVLRYAVSYRLNEDATYSETHERAVKIVKEAGLRWAKQASVSFSTSIQKIDAVSAYTLKPDGRRIDAPAGNFQVEVNSGKDSGKPAFSDQTTFTAIFPDAAVGDTLVFSYRLSASEPLFPGHFSEHEVFRRAQPLDEARVRFDWPESLPVHYRARELKEEINRSENGRRIVEWSWSNPQPPRSKRRNYSVYDVDAEPGVAFTTFSSHRQIAEAYGQRAREKAVVSERVRQLAAEVAAPAKTQREAARLLYEWVARNITYAGNCIGLGAVVPRDLDFVLDNRMGDCKDHATLLQALLAARGIDSTQALVNSGGSYRLPEVPIVAMVNHVINYLPAFDLYVDATSDATPFGMLPPNDADKPVLLVDGYRDGLRTPRSPFADNRQLMKTVVRVQPDGSARVAVDVSVHGVFAVSARDRMRDMKKETLENMVENLYRRGGHQASGKVLPDDATALLDHYHYRAEFEVKNYFSFPGSGAFSIAPYFYNEAPIWGAISSALQYQEEDGETACVGGSSVEEYRFVLPRSMKVLAIPENLKVNTPLLSYQASYRQKGNEVSVRRSLDERIPGHVCAAADSLAERDFARKVLPDLKGQVLYK